MFGIDVAIACVTIYKEGNLLLALLSLLGLIFRKSESDSLCLLHELLSALMDAFTLSIGKVLGAEVLCIEES